MTSNVAKEKSVAQTEKQNSLKGALADVLAKNAPPVAAAAQPTPVTVVAPLLTPSVAPAIALPAKPEEKKPFEIPEADLRSILKGE